MPTNESRKFTSVDAIVLISATALGFIAIWLIDHDPHNGLYLQDCWWFPWSVGFYASELNLFASALVTAWSAALCLLRLRSPHPRLSRICRQPGTVACIAVVTSALYFALQYGLLFCFYHGAGQGDWSAALDGLRSEARWSAFADWVDMSVPLVWLVLWLGKACRPEPSWIDRTGRALGVYCVAASVLFGWANLVGKA